MTTLHKYHERGSGQRSRKAVERAIAQVEFDRLDRLSKERTLSEFESHQLERMIRKIDG